MVGVVATSAAKNTLFKWVPHHGESERKMIHFIWPDVLRICYKLLRFVQVFICLDEISLFIIYVINAQVGRVLAATVLPLPPVHWYTLMPYPSSSQYGQSASVIWTISEQKFNPLALASLHHLCEEGTVISWCVDVLIASSHIRYFTNLIYLFICLCVINIFRLMAEWVCVCWPLLVVCSAETNTEKSMSVSTNSNS